MFNFLQLSALLLARPQSVRAKIDELQLLFVNAHHRLNRYRELQAADAVAGYLEQQTRRRREAAAALRQQLGERFLILKSCFDFIALCFYFLRFNFTIIQQQGKPTCNILLLTKCVDTSTNCTFAFSY